LTGSNDETINYLFTNWDFIEILIEDLNSNDLIYQFCSSIIFRQIGIYTKTNSTKIFKKIIDSDVIENMIKNYDSEVQNNSKNPRDQYLLNEANKFCKHSFLVSINSIVKGISLGKLNF
jgi:uncharacterized protein YjgD (DUF1641 family)